jgi:hypothetical protein
MEYMEYNNIYPNLNHLFHSVNPEYAGEEVDQIIFFEPQSDMSILTQHTWVEAAEEDTFIDISKFSFVLQSIQELSENYIFCDIINITDYLFKNNQLVDIIFQASKYIWRFFGRDVTLFLEVSKDPEEDYDRLFIVIGSNLPIDESLDFLEKLENDWWFGLDCDIRKLLGIDIKHIL